MKLIFREYLSSLRERGELDVIMPDLLSELGMNVLSRPGVGTRQYGVDVAAVGHDDAGRRTVFLLSIKPSNLSRSDWNSGIQSLRASLDDILDVYIPNHIPKPYADCPIVIVLCLGGDISETVRPAVIGYTDNHTTERIRFETWNGDHLANLLLTGLLREKALPNTWHSDLRKSLAMVDEPLVSFDYFCRLMGSVAEQCKPSRPARLTAIRRIYIALWTLYAWSRDGNTESAYLCSERAALVCWMLVKDHLPATTKPARDLKASMERLIELHRTIASDYIAKNVVPRAGVLHGLASAVPSRESLDVNLRLFDVLGRIGLHALWQLREFQLLDERQIVEKDLLRQDLSKTASLLIDVIANNPILCTPVKDSQAIDIDIACHFLKRVKCGDFIQQWIGNVARATTFAFRTNGPYPCTYDDYRDLLDHPQSTNEYRLDATAASTLLPTLAAWAAVTQDANTMSHLSEFAAGDYQHSTLQLLYPGSDTEEHLYSGRTLHGLNVHGFAIPDSCEDMISFIRVECDATSAFDSLSPRIHEISPLLFLACRHHRVPVPPQFWPLT